MNLVPAANGVFTTTDGTVAITADLLQLLRVEALRAERKRVRFNAHAGSTDAVHEMIIALAWDTYIAPHKHRGKIESYHIIEGEMDIAVFKESGELRRVIRMGARESGRIFYYRSAEVQFHAVVAQSEVVIFHETTSGPLIPEDTLYAPWAPNKEGPEAVLYLNRLREKVRAAS